SPVRTAYTGYEPGYEAPTPRTQAFNTLGGVGPSDLPLRMQQPVYRQDVTYSPNPQHAGYNPAEQQQQQTAYNPHTTYNPADYR
ncbi:hypothetical protein LTS18_010236, partial [Coniosporium uncinatum]